MRRILRLAAFLAVSLPLATALAVSARAVPRKLRAACRASFMKTWSRAVCRILGIRVEVAGESPTAGQWLAVSNHLGYIDIPVLGSVLPGTFVSKSEVARWPVIGFLASAAGTVFADREDRAGAGRLAEEIRRRIGEGGTVLLFPEGTSGRGEGVLPFKSAPFAAVAGDPGKRVLPMRVDVVGIEGRPATGGSRDAVCWHGDASFVPHFLRLLSLKEIRCRVAFGAPIPCAPYDRKRLAGAARERIVSLGPVP